MYNKDGNLFPPSVKRNKSLDWKQTISIFVISKILGNGSMFMFSVCVYYSGFRSLKWRNKTNNQARHFLSDNGALA